MVSLRIVNEAEEFSVITCCDYNYYPYLIAPDWDDSIEDVWDEFISSLGNDSATV